MKIVPARIEAYANRVDRRTSLIVGISCAVGAVFCVIRLVLALFAVAMMSSVGWSSPVSLVLTFVWWAVIAAITTIMAIAYLTRYAKGPQ
jgi:hypothetical protein